MLFVINLKINILILLLIDIIELILLCVVPTIFSAGNFQVKSNSALNNYWRINSIKSDIDKYFKAVILVSHAIDNQLRACFTSREGYPSERVHPSWRPGGRWPEFIAKFTGGVTLQPGATWCNVSLKGTGNNYRVKTGVHVNRSEIWSNIKGELLGLKWVGNTTMQMV